MAQGSLTNTLLGEVTGPITNTVLINDKVIQKTLTGFLPTTGIITSSDSIFSAIQKVDGNISSLDNNALLVDGSKTLTNDWITGNFDILCPVFHSKAMEGTSPLTVISTTLVDNLNSDLLDGEEGSYYLDRANFTGSAGTVSSTRLTSNTTLDESYEVIFANTDGGIFTITLPIGTQGEHYRITNTGLSNNNITISPNGSEKLFGSNTNFDLIDSETISFYYDTTDGWY